MPDGGAPSSTSMESFWSRLTRENIAPWSLLISRADWRTLPPPGRESLPDSGAFRPLPPDSEQEARTWARPSDLESPPIESIWRGLTVCSDAAPDSPLMHAGAGVEHTVSEYTRQACGMSKPTEYPTLTGDEREWLTTRDPAERDRQKEQRRKRVRSRIVRAGVAPLLDPEGFEPEQRWAVDRVNRVALMRFTLPLIDDGRRTTWATDDDPIMRHIDLWIFRKIAKRSGRDKLGPKTIVKRLLALRDVPTPNDGARVSDSAADIHDLAVRLASLTAILENEK